MKFDKNLDETIFSEASISIDWKSEYYIVTYDFFNIQVDDEKEITLIIINYQRDNDAKEFA